MRSIIAVALVCGLAASAHADPNVIVLKNAHVLRELRLADGCWRTTRLARADGSDALTVKSDEFHILPLGSKTGWTVADYQAAGPPERDGATSVRITYRPRKPLPPAAPTQVAVSYTLDASPYLRKSIVLTMAKGQAVDRLQVERFSTATPASRGGRGEPVFVGDSWFFGLQYPAARNRHSNDYASRPYAKFGNYSWIGADGRDEEFAPRPGLITLAHFPGLAKEEGGAQWVIRSKTSVAGVGRKGDTLELAFMDYLATIRRPVRSFVHYNNWYDASGKDLSIPNFVDTLTASFLKNLKPYGVTVHAMVPDNGWQNKASIWQPSPRHFPKGMDDLAALGKALAAKGSGLGLWFTFNGYNNHIDWGKEQGYHEAVRNERFTRFKRYYCIVSPKYNAALRKQLPELIRRGGLSYIKHDFNEMCCIGEGHGHLPTDRHGHEASVDEQVDLLALERATRPDIYQNITNWVWFSPWWLMHGNNLWMLSGDKGVNREWPQISTRKMAITYRDSHIHRTWGDPATRPLVPISHLMTHGIIFADRAKTETPGETLRDFSDYVVMYYGRGLQLKEWYITPKLMTPDRWKALGRATRWSEENVQTLANSVLVGGDPAQGKAYGYVCWKDGKAILTVRNPDVAAQTLTVPFDQTVWYRGKAGVAYRGRIIYPRQESLGVAMTSGKPIELTLPGYTTQIIELEPGTAGKVPTPAALTVAAGKLAAGVYTAAAPLPDEAMARCDLSLTVRGGEPAVAVDGKLTPPSRINSGKGWTLRNYDLRAYRGKTVRIAISTAAPAADEKGIFPKPSRPATVEAWLIVDRPAAMPPAQEEATHPWPVAHGTRRQTVRLMEPTALPAQVNAARRTLKAADLAGVQAAKLRVRILGSDGKGRHAKKAIHLNGAPLMPVPVSKGKDTWEEVVVDLPKDALTRIALRNTLRFDNRVNDAYKFSAVTLAVRLADGAWVTSTTDVRTHTSQADWRYKEGEDFEQGGMSKEIVVKFD